MDYRLDCSCVDRYNTHDCIHIYIHACILERARDFGHYMARIACELAPACGPVREHLWGLWKVFAAVPLIMHLCKIDGIAKPTDRREPGG